MHMDITKSTLWGALALVVLAIAIFGYRSYLLSSRDECGKRLASIATRLDRSLKPGDTLPVNLSELRKVIGDVPTSTVANLPYGVSAETLRWRQGSRRPYLWDTKLHPKVNGIHILATDGKVYQMKSLQDLSP